MPAQGSGTNIGEGGRTDTAENAETRYATTAAGQPNHQASKFQIPADYRPGWVIEVAAKVWGDANYAYLCIWEDDAEDGDLLFSHNLGKLNSSAIWRRAFPTAQNAIRVQNGKSYWCGFYVQNLGGRYYFRVDPSGQAPRGKYRGGGPVESWTGFAYETGTLAADFFYQQNAIPSTPGWVSPFASTSGSGAAPIVNTSQPTFEGTMPHNNGDADYDFTKQLQLQIWRVDTNQMLHDTVSDVTDAERSASGYSGGKFSRSPLTLPTGVEIRSRFRHADSWGAWSPWSAEIRFSCARGPYAPTLAAPAGRSHDPLGFDYAGTYSHELGLASNALQIQVLNAAETQVVHDSGTIPLAINSGGQWTQRTWHAALQTGTDYVFRARLRSRNEQNTGDIWGPWAKQPFRTNSEPYKPQDMTPRGSAQTANTQLRAIVSDPDGDPITEARIELFDVTNNKMVVGYEGPNVLPPEKRQVPVGLANFSAVNCQMGRV